MIAALSRPLAVVAAIGWVASLALSIAGIAGGAVPARMVDILFWALFALWSAAIVFVIVLANGHILSGGVILGVAFRRSPTMVRYVLWVSLMYAFLLVAASLFFRVNWVGGSVFAVMYAATLVILSTTSISLRCARDHRVGPFEQYCRACGDPIPENVRA